MMGTVGRSDLRVLFIWLCTLCFLVSELFWCLLSGFFFCCGRGPVSFLNIVAAFCLFGFLWQTLKCFCFSFCHTHVSIVFQEAFLFYSILNSLCRRWNFEIDLAVESPWLCASSLVWCCGKGFGLKMPPCRLCCALGMSWGVGVGPSWPVLLCCFFQVSRDKEQVLVPELWNSCGLADGWYLLETPPLFVFDGGCACSCAVSQDQCQSLTACSERSWVLVLIYGSLSVSSQGPQHPSGGLRAPISARPHSEHPQLHGVLSCSPAASGVHSEWQLRMSCTAKSPFKYKWGARPEADKQ